MTSQLSKLSVIALFPFLTLNCDPNESELADAQESDTGEFDQFRAATLLSLDGSQFEIDIDANLKEDPEDPAYHLPHPLDWLSLAVNDVPEPDDPSGQSDSAYSGGTKEDDVCPTVGLVGGVPKNKSDIKHFSVWQEVVPGDPGFLHLFWTRVQDPSGTTLMDFELNQSSVKCDNSDYKVRTDGDLLLEYRITQGGAQATIKLREWDGGANEWGTAVDVTAAGKAVGTINASAIPASQAGVDGEGNNIGPLSPRTFGEASIDLDVIFNEGECKSFGSAFVKSRSSDTFSSALKDVTPPANINITNCGGVTIRKDIDPDPNDPDLKFNFSMNTVPSFELGDDGHQTFAEIGFGNYTVTEAEAQTNPDYKLFAIDCSASNDLDDIGAIDLDAGTVSFAVNEETDRVDCKFINHRRGGAIKIVKTRGHAADGPGSHPHPGVTFVVDGEDFNESYVTNSNGEICIESLDLGSYTVTEDLPNDYSNDDLVRNVDAIEGSCSDVTEPEEFHNTPLTDLECRVNSLAIGGTTSTITCQGVEEVVTATTPDFGDGFLTLPNLLPGAYSCTIVISDETN
jgi:hypothetical protein